VDGNAYHLQQSQGFGTESCSIETQFVAGSDAPVYSVVKWFDAERGFGFVELPDGRGDAFLHGNVLAQSGINAVEPDEVLEVRVAPGHKGAHVAEVLSIERRSAVPTTPRPSSFREASSSEPASEVSVEEVGTVKWFSETKGFGFIVRDRDGKDVFVHISALKRSEIPSLRARQRVIVNVVEDRKGPRATRIRFL